MFIDVNYSKKPQKAKLYLSKPNKTIMSPISEKFADNLSVKLGNINELNFSIPHFLQDDNYVGLVRNKHVDLIREKMLIYMSMGEYNEWFIVDSIEESADDSDIFSVTAFSLGYELRGKRISGYEVESANATTVMTDILSESIWNIGSIDPMFDAMFRSFESGDDGNVLDCVIQVAETFGCLLVWDSDRREISLRNASEEKQFKGMTVDYGRFLRSLKRNRTSEEMTTRMWVYGSEDLTIHSANPTGQGYIEDFSYFMFPFKRDANRKVISSSFYMSDDLCHAILDHKKLLSDNSPQIKTILDALNIKREEQIIEQSKADTLSDELITIEELLDTSKAVLSTLESETPKPNTTAEKELVNQNTRDRDAKKTEIENQLSKVLTINSQIESYESQLSILQNNISNQASFTDSLREELNPYIIESTWRDDNYIDVNELYQDAIKKFVEIREPKVVIEVEIDNLMNIVEEQYYWDKLQLGELIKVKYSQMDIEYMAKIIEINFDFENGEASLTIANTKDLLSETEKLVQLLYGSQSASQIVQNNKYKWNKVNAVSKQVSQLLTNEWDANKNKIIAGVKNSIEVGNRGIIVTNPDFPQEMVIIQAGIIALSKDGGDTWKTAIKPDGIVAERLVGQIIAGNELLITNNAGSFTLDNNGAIFDVNSFIIRSSSGGANLVDRWQGNADFIDSYKDDNLITSYEKKMLKIEWDKIKKSYDKYLEKFDFYFTDKGASKAYVQNYLSKYQELYDYLFVTVFGDKPMLDPDNMVNTTRIDSLEFSSKFRDLEGTILELDTQLMAEAKRTADRAISDAKKAQETVDSVIDDIVYKIEFRSSRGFTFKNGQINTVITAKVFRGTDDITSTIPNSGFVWSKVDKDGNLDTAFGLAHQNVGKEITIDRNDVNEIATIQCDINI